MKKLKYTFLLAIVILLIPGCSDKLDLYPEEKLSNETAWSKPEDFELGTNTFYAYLLNHFETYFRDRNADIVTPATLDDISNSSYGIPTEDEDGYSKQFERLRAINYIFENAEGYENPDEIEQYVAEAKFFRAWVHWLLFRDYGPLVYMDHVPDINDELIWGKRFERDDFVDLMIKDLDEAISSFSDLPEPEEGRITEGAARALLAKVALFEGTWQKYHYSNTTRSNQLLDLAIQHASAIMGMPQYELFFNTTLSTENSYRYMFILENRQSNPAFATKADNHEYILYNRFNEDIRRSNQNITHTLQSAHYSPTLKMVNMYLCTDGLPIEVSDSFDAATSYETFDGIYKARDPRMKQSIRIPAQYYWGYGPNGRINWTGDSLDKSTQFIANPSIPGGSFTGYMNLKWCTERDCETGNEAYDCPTIRLAEIYLIYAEATFERNGTISDADLDISINKLRDRVGMPHLTNALVNTNGLDMLTEIRRERTVELYAEGNRYDDLRRWKTAEVEMSEDLLGAKISGDYATEQYIQSFPRIKYKPPVTEGKLNGDGFFIVEPAASRKFQQKHYLKPIPSAQIALNPNLEQNPGWGE